VGILGASGYAGGELLRICASHPAFEVELAAAQSQAGELITTLHPSLAATYGGQRFSATSVADCADLDLVFCALPHGASQELMGELLEHVDTVIDLGADFRLHDHSLYPTWYGAEHGAPELTAEFAFGIPELFRDGLRGATRVAVAGCYVTTAALTLAPLLAAGLIEPSGIVVDAASGVSGAGRSFSAKTHFATRNENFEAYGLLNHRHTPEIEQAIAEGTGQPAGGVQVLFTPHLVPMNRGILATCYARPTSSVTGTTTGEVQQVLRDAYADEPFVVVTDDPPGTQATFGSNAVHVHAVADPRTGWIVGIGALDNLVKGAAGQAVQCANLALGLEETSGLTALGVAP
jgi:N-acetyl-gamma-glutamyl-phosphate reductase